MVHCTIAEPIIIALHKWGLPDALARLEPYGMIIYRGVIHPTAAECELGIDLKVVWQPLQRSINVITDGILWLTGNM